MSRKISPILNVRRDSDENYHILFVFHDPDESIIIFTFIMATWMSLNQGTDRKNDRNLLFRPGVKKIITFHGQKDWTPETEIRYNRNLGIFVSDFE
jgi:hypothetical protein